MSGGISWRRWRRPAARGCARAQALRSAAVLEHAAQAAPPAPRLRLDPAGFDLIAELKLRSPAQGALRGPDEDVPAAGRRLCPGRRRGRLGAHRAAALRRLARAPAQRRPRARRRAGVPAMRKDFLVDPYQVLEARAAGAGGVLVILRMLPRAATEALHRLRGRLPAVRAARGLRRRRHRAHARARGALRAGRAAPGRAQLP